MRPLGQLISQASLPAPITKHCASSASEMWAAQRFSSFVTVILGQPKTERAACGFILPADMCCEEKFWNVFLRLILRHPCPNKNSLQRWTCSYDSYCSLHLLGTVLLYISLTRTVLKRNMRSEEKHIWGRILAESLYLYWMLIRNIMWSWRFRKYRGSMQR